MTDATKNQLNALQLLMDRLCWVAPVGNGFHEGEVLGYMVCWRTTAGCDSQVRYLRSGDKYPDSWKRPFRENECMFPTLESAMNAALAAWSLPPLE